MFIVNSQGYKTIKQIITKLREFKINNYAVFDLVISYFAAYLISFPLKPYMTKTQLFYLVLPLSVLTHTIFSVNTPLTDQFWDPKSYYVIKISIIYMIIKGLKLPLPHLSGLSKRS